MSDDLRARIEGQLLQSAFHRWLGLSVVHASAERLVLRATWREEWENGTEQRVTHGGILSALLDLGADWAIAAAMGTPAPTIDFTVNYLRAAKPGDLTVTARVTKLGRGITTAEAEVTDDAGALIAVGRGSYASFAVSESAS